MSEKDKNQVGDPHDGTRDTLLPPSHVSSPSALKHLGIEHDYPPLGKLFIFLIFLFLVIVLSGIGLANLLKLSTASQLESKVLSVENPELKEIKSRDEASLNSYDVIDNNTGVYRIPIQKAMDLLLNNPSTIEPMKNSPIKRQ